MAFVKNFDVIAKFPKHVVDKVLVGLRLLAGSLELNQQRAAAHHPEYTIRPPYVSLHVEFQVWYSEQFQRPVTNPILNRFFQFRLCHLGCCQWV